MTIQDTTNIERSARKAAKRHYQLDELYKLVAPTWPLAHAVACNPLQGLESLSFAEATKAGQELFDAFCLPGVHQLRQAQAQGYLRESDFAEAVADTMQDLPETMPLGGRYLRLETILGALLSELNEVRAPKTSSALLAKVAERNRKHRPWTKTLAAVNQQTITWLGAFLDEGQAAWGMPYRKEGFYAAVRRLLLHDPARKAQRSFLRELPDDSLLALDVLCDELAIPAQQQQAYLRDQLLALPGWASFIRWRSEQDDYTPQQKHSINLTDYLAVRLLVACGLTEAAEQMPAASREWTVLHTWLENRVQPDDDTDLAEWTDLLRMVQDGYHQLRLDLLQKWEASFRQNLSDQLVGQAQKQGRTARPEAQLAFCIDVRSEPFRRQVEATGDLETFGFAGFFGLPIAYETILGERVKSLPVLLQPAHELREVGGKGCSHQVEQHRQGRRLLKELKAAYKSLKYNLATPFAAVEALGLPAGLITIGRSLIPQSLIRLRKKGRKLFYPQIDLVPDVCSADGLGIPLDDQVTYGANALKLMGLTRNFAPLVVLCGHGSQTENNPYAAALDCGACGGSHGGPNAAAMARILNTPEVRERLRSEGINIPQDTLFIGGQHNTTTDEVCLFETQTLDGEKATQVAQLQAKLKQAQQRNLQQRTEQFGVTTTGEVLRRSTDWSEVRPEWGLAGNAGFVVAPRHLTDKLDLRGRCFLHSYDWEQDGAGTSLEVILTAPLVVAQWINSQYFFSTVDNVAFGSGSKVTHNVVGKIGVMQGNGSDLMHGLPLQSVMKTDRELYHQPLRLTAMVVAPQARVQELIDKHDILQQMFFNEWVTLQVYDPVAEQMLRLLPTGSWETV